ncbi:hypothetical protein [Brachyspira innocens]|uniref:hypothetical protein n=1 Tax=Brachyspira innocens TaxID=13264 RepID=UPI0026EFBBF1|nr:hypothetical protein [Brachyspira innocens]
MKRYKADILDISNLKFVAIGKVSFRTNKEWCIPHLHYMISELEKSQFQAICLETATYSSSNTIEDTAKKLVLNIIYDLNTLVKKSSDLDNIINITYTHHLDSYWKEYRKINFNLAKFGRNINKDIETNILKKIIEELFPAKLEEINDDIQEEINEIILINNIEDINNLLADSKNINKEIKRLNDFANLYNSRINIINDKINNINNKLLDILLNNSNDDANYSSFKIEELDIKKVPINV